MWSGIAELIKALPSVLGTVGGWVSSWFGQNRASKIAVLEYKEEKRKKEDELDKALLKTRRSNKRLKNDPRRRSE